MRPRPDRRLAIPDAIRRAIARGLAMGRTTGLLQASHGTVPHPRPRPPGDLH